MRACLVSFFGECLWSKEEDLVSDQMVYMDRVEDATAKAAVLPRLLSVPLVLRPMEAARLCLQAKIAKLICKCLSPVKAAKGEDEGPLLKHFRGIEDEAGENRVDIAAELGACIGSCIRGPQECLDRIGAVPGFLPSRREG